MRGLSAANGAGFAVPGWDLCARNGVSRIGAKPARWVLTRPLARAKPPPVVDVKSEVETWVRAAAVSALGQAGDTDPMVRSADPKFGDFQANLAMRLGKQLGKKPREISEAIVQQLPSVGPAGALDEVSIAGPGFINLRLSKSFVEQRLNAMFGSDRLGVPTVEHSTNVVVDYSSPNLAKEMHIGHLRSTIIGDAIVRVLSFRGDTVTRHNHLGDWGTQFGMLLEHLIDIGWDSSSDHSIGDLNELYQLAKARFDTEPDFKERARRRVVSLQAGEEQSLALWRQLIDESVRHMNDVYAMMGVLLRDEDIVPESFYNPRLPVVVEDLRSAGVLFESQGAQVTFPEGFKNKEGDPLPLIVQKNDGGYGYATTDLAAARFRTADLGAKRIVYVVDSRQSEHFQMVFWTLRKAAWVPADATLEHVPFGMILGKDKKPFRTREGGTVRLVDVLGEAVTRARKVIDAKVPGFDEATAADVANAVGIGAVKYADLSNERIKDYTFDYDRMLALEGNTSPYLQNAYVRICSIFRKGEVARDALDVSTLQVNEPAERALAIALFGLPSVIESVSASLEPHRLCNYLYDLASLYHAFYERCPVLKAPEPLRSSRLALCDLVARTLRLGLELLGIRVVEQM